MVANSFSTRPLYLQVRDALAERVAIGTWKPGTVIPNEGDLAREYGVSPGTMRKALDLLEDERLVTRRQGRGTFVNDQGSEELAVRFSNIRGSDGERIRGRVSVTDVAEGPATGLERDRLLLQAQERVHRIRRVRFHEDQPFMVEDASMPAALFPSLGMNGHAHGLADENGFAQRIVVLAQQHGIQLGKAQERISIGRSSPASAQILGVEQDSPVMVLDRVMFAIDGRPIEWRVGQCHLPEHHYLVEQP